MNIKIRSARLSDLNELQSFQQELIKVERPFDSTIKSDPVQYYDIAELIDNDSAEIAVVEANGEWICEENAGS